MRRVFVACVMIFAWASEARALDMNVFVDANEHLAYVNLWGVIEHGDDEKFKSIILPHVRSGNLVWKVNVFTGGGDVQAAMGMGDQIRTLRAMTVAPMRMGQYVSRQVVPTSSVQCWFFSSIAGSVANNWPNNQFTRDISKGTGPSWCNCASACFLIWASGLARTGNWVGIHRFKFNEMFFGKLEAEKAEALYVGAEKEYTGYLKKLDVPQTIIDRLYATPSTGIYYLSLSELELVSSTPYLEELTQARCGTSKAHGYWQGNSHIYEEDPQHINCYRSTLREIMASGVRAYLDKYGP